MKTLKPLARFISENDLEKKYLHYQLHPVIYKYIESVEKAEEFNFKTELKSYNQTTSQKFKSQKALKEFIEKGLVKIMYLLDVNPYFDEIQEQRAYAIQLHNLANYVDHRIDNLVRLSLLERSLQISKQIDFLSGIVKASRSLMIAHSTSKSNAKFLLYSSIDRQYWEVFNLARKSEYYVVLVKYFGGNNLLKKNEKTVKSFIDDLEPLINRDTRYDLIWMFETIRQFYFWSLKEFQLVYESCLIIEKIIIPKSFEIEVKQANSLNLAVCLIYLEKPELAYKKIKYFENKIALGTSNWYSHSLTYVGILIYNRRYKEAFKVHFSGFSHRNFNNMKQKLKEEWKILDSYISILVKANLVINESKKRTKNFRVNKFLNEVPKHSKDKNTTNATILIAHICHLILDKKYDEVIDRIDTMQKYSTRHLRKNNESYRLNCFIKMLLEIPKAGFHKEGARRKAQKFRDNLDEVLIRHTGQPLITEIIPLPVLWDIMLNSLSTKHYS